MPDLKLLFGAGALAAALLAWGSWERAGRMGEAAKRAGIEARLAIAAGQANVLARDLEACGASVQAAEAAGRQNALALRNSLAAERRRAQASAAALDRVRAAAAESAPPGASCEAAWDMIEQTEAR